MGIPSGMFRPRVGDRGRSSVCGVRTVGVPRGERADCGVAGVRVDERTGGDDAVFGVRVDERTGGDDADFGVRDGDRDALRRGGVFGDLAPRYLAVISGLLCIL